VFDLTAYITVNTTKTQVNMIVITLKNFLAFNFPLLLPLFLASDDIITNRKFKIVGRKKTISSKMVIGADSCENPSLAFRNSGYEKIKAQIKFATEQKIFFFFSAISENPLTNATKPKSAVAENTAVLAMP
jgi:hypothetical protein